MNWNVQLFKLNFDEREVQAVREVLESGWITMGQKTLDFEAAYEAELGEGSRCLGVSSGTAALHLAVLALGLGPGDEVIVPALTFIADVNVLSLCGVTPVLADVTSLADLAVSPEDIEEKITPNTRALIVVHYAGFACDMGRIVDLCERHGLALIEDCAHANGGTFGQQKLGTFGDLSAWSFFTNKNLSVGEGGMVATRDPDLYAKCKNLRSHGMTLASFDRMKGRASTYDVIEPGLNYRIDEMRSAIGLVQLDKLPDANRSRAERVAEYLHHLRVLPGISIPFVDFDRGTPTHHIFPVLLKSGTDRNSVIEGMKDQGVQCSVHYPSIHQFTAYRGIRGETPLADDISSRELTLPLYPGMQTSDVELVCNALKHSLSV